MILIWTTSLKRVIVEKSIKKIDNEEVTKSVKQNDFSIKPQTKSVNIFDKKQNGSPSDNEKKNGKNNDKILFNNLNTKKPPKNETQKTKIIEKYENEEEENYGEDEKEETTQTRNQVSNDLVEKIAQSLYKSGANKWKNSNKVTIKKPTHIIFDSDNTSSEASSSSDSSSSSEDEEEKKTKKSSPPQPPKPTPNKNQPKQKTKQEQINSKSYNRSFKIENTKDLDKFKKVFNQTKYVQPFENPENFQIVDDEHLFEQEKEPEVKIDYTIYEPLVGAPSVNQKIAFQVLELNEKFEPHMSDYKTGTVTNYDSNTNEIRLILDGTYNEVLNKPNKFTVIEDTEEDDIDNNQITEDQNGNAEEQEVSFDWSNLINVRLIATSA